MSVFDENIHPATPERAIRSAGRWGTERGRPPRVALAVGARARRMASLCPGVSGSPVLESGIGPDCPAVRARGVGGRRLQPVSQAEPTARRQSWRQYAATTLTIAASFLIALVVAWSGGTGPAVRRIRTMSFVQSGERRVSAIADAIRGVAVACRGPTADDWETVTLAAAKSSDGQPETFRVRAQRRDTLDRGHAG